MQTHVSYGFVATVLVLAGLVGAAITLWRRRTDATTTATASGRGARMLVITVGVAAVLWLPVVVQQLRDEPGNLGTLVRFFRDHGREHSYGDAWHVVAAPAQRRGPTGSTASIVRTSTAAAST